MRPVVVTDGENGCTKVCAPERCSGGDHVAAAAVPGKMRSTTAAAM
jgi:hypothetical protein